MVGTSVNPGLGMLRQENKKFEDSVPQKERKGGARHQ
jgi:hypothetical protein